MASLFLESFDDGIASIRLVLPYIQNEVVDEAAGLVLNLAGKNCNKILAYRTGPVSNLQLFSLVLIVKSVVSGVNYNLAIVEPDFMERAKATLFKTILKSQSDWNIDVFDNTEEAKAWLESI